MNRTSGAVAAHAAAMTWARGRPPSSRARSPVSKTVPAAISAAGTRNTVSESVETSLMPRAISGMTGPWSA